MMGGCMRKNRRLFLVLRDDQMRKKREKSALGYLVALIVGLMMLLLR